jgi:hypothetical protein
MLNSCDEHSLKPIVHVMLELTIAVIKLKV